MAEEVDTRVTPALHPLNVKEVDGYDETTAPYLGSVETAFSEAYLGIGQVHTAREKARANPTWNEAQQVIATDDLAQKVFSRVARQFDSAKANLDKSIAALDEQLTAPVVAKAGQSVAAEIRAHTKALGTTERVGFLRQAMANGDHMTVSAVLGAPSYLSGLDPSMQQTLTRMYHEQAAPDVAKRVRAMKGARDLIEQRGGLVFKEIEKAVGMAPHKVSALRTAKNAAEQAFILRDA